MATVFEKLNLKDQGEIIVVNTPSSFETELSSLSDSLPTSIEAIERRVFGRLVRR